VNSLPEIAGDDPWAPLRAATPARIGLGRVGTAPSLESVLQLRAAHAAARDAVWTPPDWSRIEAGLDAAGVPWLPASSRVPDRATYLVRPDLGRVLDDESRARVAGIHGTYDLAVVLVDGLSGEALTHHGVALVSALLAWCQRRSWRVTPVVCVRQGRVAIGDDVGAELGADLALVAIGERPGLSVADSLGLYLTFHPAPGRLDSERNCISNVRPGGLSVDRAAVVAEAYAVAARQQALTGTELHVEAPVAGSAAAGLEPAG
jgi:ethanolamine ammonia-lyase small subunit